MSLFCSLILAYYLFVTTVRCQNSDGNGRGTEALVQTHVEPPNFGEKVTVHVGMFIESIGNFDTRKMSIDMDFYLHMSWSDNRLMHNHPKYRLVQDYQSLSKMWLPDLYIVNAKWSKFQTVSTPNFCAWILPNGTVAYSARVTCGVSCPLNLIEYPLDEQSCAVKLMSYGHSSDELELQWFEDNAIKLNENIELPELGIVGHSLETCNYNYSYAKTSKHTLIGQFSCLKLVINFKRAITYHLVQTFIPTGLIVGISWVSFWIDRNAVPARVTLSFTTLLTLSTMAAGVRYSLPPVSYAKAIDIWMGACMILVFAALLEFAIVNSYSRRAVKCDKSFSEMADEPKQVPNKKTSSVDKKVGVNSIVNTGYSMVNLKEQKNLFARRALIVDKVSRVLFPLLFLIFNLIFWLICMDAIPVKKWLKIVDK